MNNGRLPLFLLWLVPLLFSTLFSAGQNNNLKFTASSNEACVPAIITFKATNVDASKTIDWVIRNDTFPDRKKLVKLFLQPGQYDVTMLETNQEGKISKTKAENFINIGQAPTNIKVTPSKSKLCEGPGKITFNASGKNIQEWNWVIANKKYEKAGPSVTHNFQTPGYKNVSVNVVDELGCNAVKAFDSMVYVEDPIKPEINVAGKKGFSEFKTNFDAQNNRSDIQQYEWNLPGSDQSRFSDKTPGKITYPKKGLYNVKLSITTEKGCQFETFKKNFIQVVDSIDLAFKASRKRVCPKENFKLINNSVKSGGGSFEWEIQGPDNKTFSNTKNASLALDKPGSYDVTLSYHINGIEQTLTKTDLIKVKALNASFNATPTCNCTVPTKVEFNNTTSTPDSGNTMYEWTMWDEGKTKILNLSNDKNPSFTYKNLGNYDVRLVAKHSNGCIDTAYKEDFISLEEFPDDLELDFETYATNIPIQLGFPNLSFCTQDSLQALWKIYHKNSNQLIKVSSDLNPFVTFSKPGEYKVNLTVSTNSGCQSSSKDVLGGNDTQKDNINVVEPEYGIITPKDSTPYNQDPNKRGMCAGNTFIFEEDTKPEVLNYKHRWTISHQEKSQVEYTGWGKQFQVKLDTPGVYDVYYEAYADSVLAFDTLKKGFLHVHGANAQFSQNILEPCLPYESQVKAQIDSQSSHPNLVNRNFQWSSADSSALSFKNINQQEVNVKTGTSGNHSLALTIKDTMGCTNTIKRKHYIAAGLKADFSMPEKGCLGDQIVANNKAFEARRDVNYQWTSPSNQLNFLNSSTSKNQELAFQDSGHYDVTLALKDQYNCTDSITKSIAIERVDLEFAAEDTIHKCAPALVDFNTKASENVEQFHWDFGDDLAQKTKDTNLTHTYHKNSGDKNSGFDVKLTAQTAFGCQKTVHKSSYITIIGPVPDFKISETQGCEPFEVSFKNTGKNITNAFMDYGDLSNVDSSASFDHTYRIKDEKSASEQFRPIMIAKDNQNCHATKKAEKPIKVFKKPDAQFTMDTTKGCEPIAIEFNNTTNISTSTEWDFSNNDSIEATTEKTEKTYQKGVHDIRMMVETDQNCRDTITKKQALKVLETPKPDFSSSDSVICPESTVTFNNETQINDIPLKEVTWQFETDQGKDTVRGEAKAEQAYPRPGRYDVSITAKNKKGCKATLTKDDHIISLDKIAEEPELNLASTTDQGNEKINIQWQTSSAIGFGAYHIIKTKGSSNTEKFIIEDQNQTNFLDDQTNLSNSDKVAYQLTIEGQCGFFTDTTRKHSLAPLTVESDSFFTNDLTWDSYQGWDQVDAYRILRGKSDQKLKPIATVDGQTHHYRDRHLCQEAYCYKIVAISEEKGFKSLSKKVCQTPKYDGPTIGGIVQQTTVKDDDLQTDWNSPKTWEPDYYRIDKKEKGARQWKIGYAKTENRRFEDQAVNVNQEAYQYRVLAANHCGELSNRSNLGSSINLQTTVGQEQVELNWNKYEGWPNRPTQYEVQLNKGAKGFQTIATINGRKTSFTDQNLHSGIDTAYEYRVVAKGTRDKKSVSNSAWAILPSNVFVPNAFSPNGDGLNDEFEIHGNSLDNFNKSDINQFQMTIFNKWGEKVFESKSLAKGWDGTDQKGNKVAIGSYLYQIQVHGLDGKAYYLKGQVQVVR